MYKLRKITVKKAFIICLIIITALTASSCEMAEEIINSSMDEVNNMSKSSQYTLFSSDLIMKASEKQLTSGTLTSGNPLALLMIKDYEISTDFIFKLNGDGTCSVFGAINPLAKELSVPEKSPGGRPVTSIHDYAFYMQIELETITIPNTVSTIGRGAFADCKSLKAINVPDDITEIGDGAFMNCTSLENLVIPESVTKVGDWAFTSCAIKSLSIPDSVIDIGTGVFFSCDNLETVDMPSGITEITEELFHYCPSLTNVDIPKGVQSIGKKAFMSCTSLNHVEIPDGVKSIGAEAFSECSNLETIEIPDGLTEIGPGVFFLCSRLDVVRLPEGITTIPSGAFAVCGAKVKIPKSVKVIEEKAFNYYCGTLFDISYAGTWDEWCEIDIGPENNYLNDAESMKWSFSVNKLHNQSK